MASNQTTTSKITLDLYAKNVVAVNAKQYDDETRYIEITCVENGVIYTLDKTIMSAFLRLKKPDDNGVFNEVEITDTGKIKIVLTEQMLAASGRAIVDVFLIRRVFTSNEKPTDIDDIYKVNAPIISIMDFYINITPTALNHSQIESSYEFNALTNALAQIDFNNKKVVELDKTLTANENVRQNNENVRKSNEEQRISAENVRIESEKQRLNAENTRNLQEATRVSNEQKRIDSENTRVSNENDRKSNEDTRKSNETQRQSNEDKRISAETKRENSETKRQSNETQREQNEKLRKDNEDQRISNEQTRVSNEKSRNDAEAERIKNENTRISNETTRQSQESKRQTDTATAITNANNAAKNANDKANDLQNKLDNNYFVLTNELENSVSSTSTTHAPTANAVKIAYDKAVSVENTINSNKNNWNDKYTKNEIDNKFSTLENNINWKESVNTFADIAKTYPKPEDGWTVNVKDTDYTYRYSGSTWVAISANAIPKATQTLDGLMSKEDKTNYDDANSKKHTHSNKSVLDGITSALVTTWNTVTNKLDKTGDASNTTNTITAASTRANLTTGEKLSISLGKIAKWFSDLKIVAFSGSYNDLSNKPSSMPANGGNSTTVNGHTVNSDVPANAKFTDTNTWRGIQNNLTSDSTSDSLSAAQGKVLKALIDAKKSNTGTLTGIKMNGVSKGTSGVVDLGTVLTADNYTNYAASKSHSHSYNDLTNKPSIPSVGNGVVTITQNGVSKGAFHMNQSGATNIDLSDSYIEYPMYSKIIDGNYATKFRTETKGDTSHGGYISTIRNNTANVANSPQFGSGIAFGLDDTHGYLYLNYSSAEAYLGGGNQDKLNWIKRIAFTDSTVANATKVNNHTVNADVPSGAKFTDTNTWRPLGTTADTACAGNDSRLSNARPASDVYSWAKQASKPSYSWSEITGKPSSFTPASHTHNYIPTSASCNKNWNWSGKNGQPKWLWGGDDGANMYVYNPSNFSVNYANSAGSVAWANVSGKPSNYTPSSHASTATTYGKGTATNYGHVKLTDVYTSSLGDASSGVAPSQLALYGLYNYVKTNELWTKYVSIGTVNGITLYYRYNNLGMCEIYFNGNLSNNISAYDTSFKWTNEIPKKPLNRILIPVVAQQNGLCLLCYPGEINWCLFSYQGTISKGTFICGSHIYTYK